LKERKPFGYVRENSSGTGRIEFLYGNSLLIGKVKIYPELSIYHTFDYDMFYPENADQLPELLHSYSVMVHAHAQRYSIHEFPPRLMREKLQGAISGGHIDFDKKNVETEMIKYLMRCSDVELSMFVGENKELLEKLLAKEEIVKLVTEP